MFWQTKAPALVVLCLAALLSACESIPPYRDSAESVTAVSEDMSRVYFYGDTTAWKGLRGRRLWRPTLMLNGEAIATTHGREVVFFVDRTPGTFEITVNNDIGDDDAPAPEAYPGQSVSFEARPGHNYYVKLIRHGPDSLTNLSIEPQQHYLQLKKVHQVLGEVEVGRFGYTPRG